MFHARTVEFQIKNGKQDELTQLLNNDVLPVLKRQDGFKSELALVSGGRATTTSVWRDRDSAMKYEKTTYPEIMRSLNPVIDGTPTVHMADVAASTLA